MSTTTLHDRVTFTITCYVDTFHCFLKTLFQESITDARCCFHKIVFSVCFDMVVVAILLQGFHHHVHLIIVSIL